MQNEEKIHEGMFVEIKVAEGDYKGRYRTRIEEMGNRVLSIGVPISEGQFIPLREGTAIEIIFADEVSAYSFSTTIIKRLSYPIPTFIVEQPKKIKKIQRRRFVRVPLVYPFKYHVFEEDGLSAEKNGFINDLSGGGLLFKAKENLSAGTIVYLKIKISDTEMELPARVVRSQKDIEAEKDYYIISVEFQDITEKIRDKIISYVFDIQREMRKKGLI